MTKIRVNISVVLIKKGKDDFNDGADVDDDDGAGVLCIGGNVDDDSSGEGMVEMIEV